MIGAFLLPYSIPWHEYAIRQSCWWALGLFLVFAAVDRDPCLCLGSCWAHSRESRSPSTCTFGFSFAKGLSSLPQGHPQTWDQPCRTTAGDSLTDCMGGWGCCGRRSPRLSAASEHGRLSLDKAIPPEDKATATRGLPRAGKATLLAHVPTR